MLIENEHALLSKSQLVFNRSGIISRLKKTVRIDTGDRLDFFKTNRVPCWSHSRTRFECA
ncbi:hypothetical protein [Brevibacillus sp. 1238]|uniref:hypothetical protein n=1 Tax=unclassified Brevibacillus TaxID=2684853 RepID=UPI0024730CFC|nr:hypothetical protein [Brevibacillus sp. 1238]